MNTWFWRTFFSCLILLRYALNFMPENYFYKGVSRPCMLTFAILKLDLVSYFYIHSKEPLHFPFTPPICYTTYIINLYTLRQGHGIHYLRKPLKQSRRSGWLCILIIRLKGSLSSQQTLLYYQEAKCWDIYSLCEIGCIVVLLGRNEFARIYNIGNIKFETSKNVVLRIKFVNFALFNL